MIAMDNLASVTDIIGDFLANVFSQCPVCTFQSSNPPSLPSPST